MKLQIKHTADGSSTIYLPDMNEQYHSLNGALTESEHVFLDKGFRFHPKPDPVVFEVGFGTGLNALLTAHQAKVQGRQVFYISIENYPLAPDMVNELDYGR
ncbi:MAG: SAM-dependent methyltransferase, partial [Bacteroidota bacterium]